MRTEALFPSVLDMTPWASLIFSKSLKVSDYYNSFILCKILEQGLTSVINKMETIPDLTFFVVEF